MPQFLDALALLFYAVEGFANRHELLPVVVEGKALCLVHVVQNGAVCGHVFAVEKRQQFAYFVQVEAVARYE